MIKLIKHYKLWYEWQKNCLNTWYYKLAILLGLWVSPTFEEFKGRARSMENFKNGKNKK